MLIAWSTVPSREDAQRLAHGAIARDLAVCVHIDGPLTTVYRWQGKIEEAAEYRLTFKVLPPQAAALAEWVHSVHPYDTPQWIAVRAEIVGEKYLSWAEANSSNLPL